MSDFAALHAVVQGGVQGVYYRAFVSGNAARLGLCGYVLNRPDNSAEIHAERERKQLENLVEQLKSGHPGVGVDNLELTWSEYAGQYSDFSVTR